MAMRSAGRVEIGLPCLAPSRSLCTFAGGRGHDVNSTGKLRGERPHLWRPAGLARRAGRGLACGLHRIERLMRTNALRARPRRRALPRDDGLRMTTVAPNVLDRQFTADQPNRKWIADFTYIWTAEGWLYVAAVIDLLSRRVVGDR